MSDFGDRLRKTRIAMGRSQQSAARRAGITRNNWSDYERGVRNPSLGMAIRLFEDGLDHRFCWYVRRVKD